MSLTLMNLKILMPFQIFAEKSDIRRIVADTCDGSVGFLPHRLDCAVALVPGILIYENEIGDEVYVAIDEGVLVKTGLNVLVSVRSAVAVSDLSRLREMVERETFQLDERDKNVRQVLSKMESSFVRHLVEFHHE